MYSLIYIYISNDTNTHTTVTAHIIHNAHINPSISTWSIHNSVQFTSNHHHLLPSTN